MDQTVSAPDNAPDLGAVRPPPPTPARKRSISGGLFSKLPFGARPRPRRNTEETDVITSAANALPVPSFRTIPAVDPSARPPVSNGIHQHHHQQQQPPKTRRRRGSLRKVALLGRGARREDRGLTIDTTFLVDSDKPAIPYTPPSTNTTTPSPPPPTNPLGLGISDTTPRPSMDGYAHRPPAPAAPSPPSRPTTTTTPTNPHPTLRSPLDLLSPDSALTSPYSTTDDEDNLHMASAPRPPTLTPPTLLRPIPSAPPSTLQHRRTIIQQAARAKSPLALTSLASAAPPEGRGDWDYAETEWWGWVVLVTTWTVFVTGMGSCLGVWSWAWDVGTTPYAPPELEDDPTLPIVGYYPALIILTAVMAWVWVVVAWVGMKYFRHARVSGD